MGTRTYPPQPWIHETSCNETPHGLPSFKARELPTAYPLGRPHTCFDKDTVTFNRDCVAEPFKASPHRYLRSTIWPEDATGPLCAICRGSHPESALIGLSLSRRRRAG